MSEFFTILAGFVTFYQDVKQFILWRQSVSDSEWSSSGAEVFKAIREAKTDEERRALVRRLADLQRNS